MLLYWRFCIKEGGQWQSEKSSRRSFIFSILTSLSLSFYCTYLVLLSLDDLRATITSIDVIRSCPIGPNPLCFEGIDPTLSKISDECLFAFINKYSLVNLDKYLKNRKVKALIFFYSKLCRKKKRMSIITPILKVKIKKNVNNPPNVTITFSIAPPFQAVFLLTG